MDAVILTDQHGTRRSLVELARQPTLVTFAFGHCATVCPTVIRDLDRARRKAGRTEVPLVLVTVDPWRDTPSRLATLARQWQLSPHDLVLSGEVGEVETALDALDITRTRNLTTGDVGHVATVLWMDQGRVQARLDGGWSGVGALLGRE
jgi:protein SCO1/2